MCSECSLSICDRRRGTQFAASSDRGAKGITYPRRGESRYSGSYDGDLHAALRDIQRRGVKEEVAFLFDSATFQREYAKCSALRSRGDSRIPVTPRPTCSRRCPPSRPARCPKSTPRRNYRKGFNSPVSSSPPVSPTPPTLLTVPVESDGVEGRIDILFGTALRLWRTGSLLHSRQSRSSHLPLHFH